MDLDSMKYAELQRLAKEVGLKANMKADKLLKALKEHYQQQEGLAVIQEPEDEDIGSHDNNNADEPEPKRPVFVTKRRGKGHKTKRKRSGDAEAECDPELSDRPAEEAEPSIGSGGAKRRRLSEVENSGMAVAAEGSKETNPEAQPDHKDGVSVACEKGGEQKLVKAGKIPRHEGLLKRTKPMLRPTTPNFKKLHEAHFNKMESLDSYVQRRTKQVDMYRNSVKELKLLSEKTIMKPAAGETQAKSNLSRTSLFSPAPVEKRPATDKRRHTQLSASKPTQKDNVSFRPTVLSTRRINVRFSQATQDNEHKRSLVKTPARLSTRVDRITPGKETNVAGKPDIKKTSAVSTTKTPGTFVFNGNTSISNTPGTNTKPLFDLKASLSRPLAYKPHKGKLKPFAETKENTAESNSQTTQSHQMNYKQHQVPTREERRTKHTDGRKQKKEKMLGARRGLVMT